MSQIASYRLVFKEIMEAITEDRNYVVNNEWVSEKLGGYPYGQSAHELSLRILQYMRPGEVLMILNDNFKIRRL